MMTILSVHDTRVESKLAFNCKSLQEMSNHITGQVFDKLVVELRIHQRIAATAQVKYYLSERFVKGHESVGNPDDPTTVANCFMYRTTQCDGDVLDGMMPPCLQVTFGSYCQIEGAVAAKLH